MKLLCISLVHNITTTICSQTPNSNTIIIINYLMRWVVVIRERKNESESKNKLLHYIYIHICMHFCVCLLSSLSIILHILLLLSLIQEYMKPSACLFLLRHKIRSTFIFQTTHLSCSYTCSSRKKIKKYMYPHFCIWSLFNF